MPDADDEPDGHDRCGKRHLRPADAGKAAEQPEHHAARLFGIGRRRDDVGGERVEQLRGGNARKNRPVRRLASARQHHHEDKGDQRAGKGPGGKRDRARAKAEQHDTDCTRRGSSRNAENIGFGQRVPQQRLQDRPRQRQSGAAECRDQRPRQAIIPDHRFLDARQGHGRKAEPVRHRRNRRLHGNGHLTDRHPGNDGDEKR